MLDFWRNRSVLLTGHTGFKGSWLSLWLRQLGANVTGLSLAPRTEPNLWSIVGRDFESVIGNICDAALVQRVVAEVRPQIVIHMAAQALVRDSYRDPLETYATNVIGTANILQACRAASNLECVLVVTSDKVYENRNQGRAFTEDDRLGGHDPYSNSKACTELVTQSFRDSFYKDGPPVLTARAGNVIGGGDWAHERLIPDCVRALDAGRPVSLRSPKAVRPWQHVLEPLSGYLSFVQHLVSGRAKEPTPRALNFGPDPQSFLTVCEVVEAFSARFGGAPGWTDDGGDHPPESQLLTLSSELAGRTLHWRPCLDVETALTWTADWYREHRAAANVEEICLSQISAYEKRMAV